jgi:hypothetical protein
MEASSSTLNRFSHKYSLFLLPLMSFIFHSSALKAQCCDYTISMHDSYGDGWNGAHLQVLVNSNSVGVYSAQLYGSFAIFQACTGDTIEFVYTPGDYENENSYEVFNQNWNLLFNDGPVPLLGQIFDTIADCNAIIFPGNHPCTSLPLDTATCVWLDNSNAPGSGINAGCANYNGSDVWLSMLVPPSGNISLQTDSGNINDTGIAAWISDSSCLNLQYLGCDDDAGNGYYSLLSLYDLTPGKTLFVQVFGYGGATGTFNLCATDLGTISLDSTELPLVMINTLGQQIIPDVKINAIMDIKYNGPGNMTYVTDFSNVYSGNIGIEIRGATSSGYPQRPYNIETRTSTGANNNVSLLGMPVENDWVLLSNYNDRSLIRNTLAYKIFGQMGNYSVRTHLCEVLVDSSYKGIYVFGEKIKRDNNRVDIAKLTSLDNTGDDLTGGYILEQNYWDANNSFLSNYSPIDHPTFDVHFVYKEPGTDSITIQQRAYIASFIDSLEDALYSPNFADTVLGYRKYLDTKSFIDYFLVNELARSNDGFKKSVFFHKDKYSNGGKLKAGPVWDFDWAWKNMFGCNIFESTDGSGWAHHINDCPTDNYSCGYYVRLLQDTTFNNELRCRYEAFRASLLDTANIFNYIDSIRTLVQNAQARHFQKWPLLGVSGQAPEVGPIATTYNAELDTLKYWINLRLQWLDANIPGNCSNINITNKFNPLNQLFKCFPNPSNEGIIYFEGNFKSTTPTQIFIYDLTGKLVKQTELKADLQKVAVFIENKGAYIYKLMNQQAEIQRGKIVVL